MKSPLPDLELRPGQADINALLSLVEDIIRQQNQAAGDFYTDASKREQSAILSLRAVNLQGKQHLYLHSALDIMSFWLVQLTRLIKKKWNKWMNWYNGHSIHRKSKNKFVD